MNYLKCNHCHHYNSINSKYLIFCESCGKKLSNNFKEWQKKHPNQTLEDFAKTVGTLPTQIQKTKKLSFRKILQICFVVISISLGSYFGKEYSSPVFRFFYELTFPVSDLLNEKWDKQFFMGNKIVIESPFWLEKQEEKIEFPEQVAKLVKEMDVYAYNSFAGFGSVVITATYDEKLKKLDPKSAGDAAIAQTFLALNGSDLFYNDENVTVNNFPGIVKKGTFKSHGNEIHFKSITCIKDDLTLIFFITYWSNQLKDYDLLSDRMLGSLEIY